MFLALGGAVVKLRIRNVSNRARTVFHLHCIASLGLRARSAGSKLLEMLAEDFFHGLRPARQFIEAKKKRFGENAIHEW